MIRKFPDNVNGWQAYALAMAKALNSHAIALQHNQPIQHMRVGELLDHMRPLQVLRGWAGIAMNVFWAVLSPKHREHLFNELQAVEASLKQVKGLEGVSLVPYGYADRHGDDRTVSWWEMLTNFGKADINARQARINIFLPSGMKLLAAAHETAHLLNPEENDESRIIKIAEVYIKARQDQVAHLAEKIQSTEKRRFKKPDVDGPAFKISSKWLNA